MLIIFGRKASWDNLPKEFTQIYNQVTAICQFHNGDELFQEQHSKLSVFILIFCKILNEIFDFFNSNFFIDIIKNAPSENPVTKSIDEHLLCLK